MKVSHANKILLHHSITQSDIPGANMYSAPNTADASEMEINSAPMWCVYYLII